MDNKIALASRGIVRAIQNLEDPLPAGVAPLRDDQKYTALYIIRHHIHTDLKSEYLEEESPFTLFQALKTRYEQQNAVVMPKHSMNGLIFDSRTSSPWEGIIMKFIRYVPNCVFARRSLQMQRR